MNEWINKSEYQKKWFFKKIYNYCNIISDTDAVCNLQNTWKKMLNVRVKVQCFPPKHKGAKEKGLVWENWNTLVEVHQHCT